MRNEKIGIFDSGAGGLTVLSACRKLLQSENFLYISDRAYAPYGNREKDYIIGRSFACVNRLLESGCKAVVVACNTATNVGIETLRQSFPVPFIGVEPPLRPVYEINTYKNIVVLCTNVTAESEKFQNLLQKYHSPRFIISPQKDLALLIENNLFDLEKIRSQVYQILANHPSADAFVLGCTHYNFIESMIVDFFKLQKKEIKIFESSVGTANRLKTVLTQNNLLTSQNETGRVHIVIP